MIFLTKFLTILYAGFMTIAAVASYKQLPLWLSSLNVLIGALLILVCLMINDRFVVILLMAFLIIALINGYYLHGQVTWWHWLIRLVLTVILSWLNIRF